MNNINWDLQYTLFIFESPFSKQLKAVRGFSSKKSIFRFCRKHTDTFEFAIYDSLYSKLEFYQFRYGKNTLLGYIMNAEV